jgi:hypothetical protein
MPVRSLLHYALEVPDQARGQSYYTDFGLQDASGGSKCPAAFSMDVEQG